MKTSLAVAFVLACLALPLAGCRPSAPDDDSGGKSAGSGKSTVTLLTEGVTGKHAIDAGRRATARIEAIAEKQRADLGEVLEE